MSKIFCNFAFPLIPMLVSEMEKAIYIVQTILCKYNKNKNYNKL